MPRKFYRRYRKRKRSKTMYTQRPRVGRSIIPWKSAIRTGSNVVHTFRQTLIDADINSSNALARSGAYAVNVQQFDNFAAWTQLYDQYRILKVIYRFMPIASQNDNAYPDVFTVPQFYTAIDYDDNSTPASLNEILQYSTLKITPGSKTHIRIFTPAVASAVYQGVASTGYSIKKFQWINVANSTVPHYGLKYYLPPHSGGAASIVKFNVFITIVVQFKAVR